MLSLYPFSVNSFRTTPYSSVLAFLKSESSPTLYCTSFPLKGFPYLSVRVMVTVHFFFQDIGDLLVVTNNFVSFFKTLMFFRFNSTLSQYATRSNNPPWVAETTPVSVTDTLDTSVSFTFSIIHLFTLPAQFPVRIYCSFASA